MRTCLICDDHVLVREALAGTVRLIWPDIVITEVGDFSSAWTAASAQPDLCVADLIMPGANPLVGIAGIVTASSSSRVLVVTGTQDDSLMLDLLDLGIAGFAHKTASGAIIESALRLVAAGGRYLPPRIAEIAASRIDLGRVEAAQKITSERASRLTDRQIEILSHVARGAPTKEVAIALGVAPSTIKSHIAHIQDCLGARNRTDAVIKATALGLL